MALPLRCRRNGAERPIAVLYNDLTKRTNATLVLASLVVVLGCAGTVPPVPDPFPYAEPGARERCENLRRSVQAVVDGWGNLGRRSAILERAHELGLADLTTTEWIDWFSLQSNVLIEVPAASGAPEEIVYVVAHYDRTDGNPLKLASILVNGLADELITWSFLTDGAVDNATGVALALEIARAAKEEGVPRTCRVLLVGSEESGLRGSRAHAARLSEEEWRRLAFVVNVDCVGVGDRRNAVIRDESDEELVSAVLDAAERAGVPLVAASLPVFGTSDQESFRRTGFWADFWRGIEFNLTGGLLPQRSWFARSHSARTVFFSAEDLADAGDWLGGLLLLPLGRLHGPRDRASNVDPTRLYEAYRVVWELVRE
jgi:hypothetical protein